MIALVYYFPECLRAKTREQMSGTLAGYAAVDMVDLCDFLAVQY